MFFIENKSIFFFLIKTQSLRAQSPHFPIMMKVRNSHFKGPQLMKSLSMYLQGCKESVFELANANGLSCCYRTVINYLDDIPKGTNTHKLLEVNILMMLSLFIYGSTSNAKMNSSSRLYGIMQIYSLLSLNVHDYDLSRE